MIKKTENCLYCGEKMESKTAKKKFCSDLHRVYWNRENKVPKPKSIPADENKAQESTQNKNTDNIPITDNSSIEAQIKAYEEELKRLGTGQIGKDRKKFIEAKIKSLKK